MTPLRRWFLTIARLEGLSLLLLLGVAMPLKYVAGDPTAVAWVGWVHGILFLVYVVAAGSVARVERWSWGTAALGLGASVVPLGTWWFERRLVASPAPTRADVAA